MAQGIYYVLRNLVAAGLLATQEEASANVWATLSNLLLLQALQAGGVLAAGLLTGAGQRRGFLWGALVGMWNGVFFLLVEYWWKQPLTAINLVGDPILQVAFGAVGGLAGSLIWKPPQSLQLPALGPVPLPLPRGRRATSPFAGPVAWTRVLTGIALSVGGVVWVDIIREFVLDASEGRLRIDTHLQTHLVTWEISALAMLAGSALAGSTTLNGLKQGLCVGIGTATVLLGVRLAGPQTAPELLLATLISALFLSLVGGWFGGQLLPPIYGPPRRKRIRTASL
jgi:hypothetical protein